MWIFAKFGFVSIVLPDQVPSATNRAKPDDLMVRGREQSEVEYFAEQCCIVGVASLNVIETPDADYRYRIFVNRNIVAEAVKRLVNYIDYSNFKDECQRSMIEDGKSNGHISDRMAMLHGVWGAANTYQVRRGMAEDAKPKKRRGAYLTGPNSKNKGK